MNNRKLHQRDFLRLCATGDYDEIENAIDSGASVNRRARYNGAVVPPLFVAVLSSNFEAMKALIKHKAKPIYGFIAAMVINDKYILRYLVKCGANVNCRDVHGRTPLLCAVSAGKSEVVEWLIALGADVDCKAKSGYTALTYAALMFEENESHEHRKAISDIISSLLEAGADYSGAMLAAVKLGDCELLDILLDNGADINKPCALGQTPISIALLNLDNGVSPGFIDYMLACGANANDAWDCGDGLQSTNLNAALSMNSPKAVEFLLEHGADPNIKDTKGRTPLMYSVLTGLEVTETLLRFGADPNIGDNEGRTALMVAIIDGDSEGGVVDVLLEYGANPDFQDSKGRTALMWAIMDRDRSPEYLLQALIRTGGLSAECGKACFAVAGIFAAVRRETQLEIIRTLLRNGADLSIRANDGASAELCAMFVEDDEIVKMLRAVRKEERGVIG
ncbi:MAG: ankyrin repeat domain-containing protein [Synergistaceae bacterium]|nr:ankyrin repeat domain-containing protein [Synergistaceae bacterium]